ncbi:transglutaminase domain-containing protein, partial [Coprococcus sp. ART55/1]|uniref:transglutaminase domain-containing protein n=1 Tax=Coprococcus sp. ART55/1 TaxID=751585 RepID=UPI00273A4283
DAYTAYGALVLHQSVCDGYAEAFFIIMSCLGVKCDIVVGRTEEGLHAWNQIELGGEWYNVDLTWDDSLPDMGSYLKHTYVNVDDSTLELTHSWEKQFYRGVPTQRIISIKRGFIPMTRSMSIKKA